MVLEFEPFESRNWNLYLNILEIVIDILLVPKAAFFYGFDRFVFLLFLIMNTFF